MNSPAEPSTESPPFRSPAARRRGSRGGVRGALSVATAAAVALAGAVALSAATGAGLATGASRTATVVPLAMACAAVLGWLALTRFAAFVVVILAVRASLDIAKLGGRLDAGREAGTAAASDWLDPGALLGLLFGVTAALWLAAQPSRRRATAPTGPDGAPVLMSAASPPPPGRSRSRALWIGSPPAAATALVGASLLSLPGSGTPATSAAEVLRITTALLMIFVVARLVSSGRCRRSTILAAVFAAAVPPVLLTAGQLVTGRGLTDVHGLLRPAGTFWHPNTLGAFCALLLVMGLALLPHLRGGARVGLLAGLPGIGFALVAAGARGPWLAALAGAAAVALIQDRRLLLWIGGTAATLVTLVPSVSARLGDLSPAATTGTTQDSLTWRFEHWREALGQLHENPITGIGLGATRSMLGREVHNDYLRALVETGVLGLLAYLSLLASLAVTAYRALLRTAPESLTADRAGTSDRTAAGSTRRGIAVGYTGCLVVLMVYAIADNVMTSVAVLWYFAAIAGLALAIGTDDGTHGMRAVPAAKGTDSGTDTTRAAPAGAATAPGGSS